MRRRRDSSLDLLDEAGDLVPRAAPALAVLWLTALPARLLLALFAVRLARLGAQAAEYGSALLHLAFAALGLWLISLWGRQVYLRACRRALEGDEGARLVLRVPLSELAGAVFAALAAELAFWLLSFTVVVPLAMLPAAALAAAAAPRAGPGVLAPLRAVAGAIGSPGRLLALLLWMLVALLLAALNLFLLFQLGAWAAGPLLGVEGPAWAAILALDNPLFAALLLAGATLLVEPFWLAAMTAHVERVRAASSGEDLRQWFDELRAGSREVA